MTKLDTSGKQARITYLGIGSNLGNKKDNIEKSKSLLIENNINLISVSSYYNTPSWPNPKNPDFIKKQLSDCSKTLEGIRSKTSSSEEACFVLRNYLC